ncbi:putative SacI homology domain containing protein [Blattamonas nauphoetae]|uniref:SacI homology domain containing protein n=1 Tax=Blattamonas nauphoetae TaxID=2049346 RepID=A0ABQ9YLB9_9EUKA|nr:putative SacI homology domain containing protein [Blattamonas nauphoetae]
MRFNADRYHYFCEEVDITRPFSAVGLKHAPQSVDPHPSESDHHSASLPIHLHNVHDYDPAYVWNSFLRQKFEEANLHDHCVVLLQGAATTYPMSLASNVQIGTNMTGNKLTLLSRLLNEVNSSPDNKPTIFLSVISRKSSLNPGTRYQARGLNEFGGAGNEMECEVIVWLVDKSFPPQPSSIPQPPTGYNVSFASYVFFRGTIPILWKTSVDSFFTQAKVDVDKNTSFDFVPQYWDRVRRRVNCADSMDRTSVASFSFMLPIVYSQLTTLLTAFIQQTDLQPVEQREYGLLEPLEPSEHLPSSEIISDTIPPGILSSFSESFLILANTNSELYTDSAATHTQIIRSFISTSITNNAVFSLPFSCGLDASSLIHIPSNELDLSLFTSFNSTNSPFTSMMTFLRKSTYTAQPTNKASGTQIPSSSNYSNALISIKRRYHNIVTDDMKNKEFTHFVALQMLPVLYPGIFWKRTPSDLIQSLSERTSQSSLTIPTHNILPSPPLTSSPHHLSLGAIFSLNHSFHTPTSPFRTYLPLHLSSLLQSSMIITPLPILSIDNQEKKQPPSIDTDQVKQAPKPLALTSIPRGSLADRMVALGITSIIDTTEIWKRAICGLSSDNQTIEFNLSSVQSTESIRIGTLATSSVGNNDEIMTIVLPELSIVRYLVFDRPTTPQEPSFHPYTENLADDQTRLSSQVITTPQTHSTIPTAQWAAEGESLKGSMYDSIVSHSDIPSSLLLYTPTSVDVWMGETLDSLVLTHSNVHLPIIPNTGLVDLEYSSPDSPTDSSRITNVPKTFFRKRDIRYMYQSVILPVSPYPVETSLSRPETSLPEPVKLPFVPLPMTSTLKPLGLVKIVRIVFHAPLSYRMLDTPSAFSNRTDVASHHFDKSDNLQSIRRAIILGRVRVLGNTLRETTIPSERLKMWNLSSSGIDNVTSSTPLDSLYEEELERNQSEDVLARKNQLLQAILPSTSFSHPPPTYTPVDPDQEGSEQEKPSSPAISMQSAVEEDREFLRVSFSPFHPLSYDGQKESTVQVPQSQGSFMSTPASSPAYRQLVLSEISAESSPFGIRSADAQTPSLDSPADYSFDLVGIDESDQGSGTFFSQSGTISDDNELTDRLVNLLRIEIVRIALQLNSPTQLSVWQLLSQLRQNIGISSIRQIRKKFPLIGAKADLRQDNQRLFVSNVLNAIFTQRTRLSVSCVVRLFVRNV